MSDSSTTKNQTPICVTCASRKPPLLLHVARFVDGTLPMDKTIQGNQMEPVATWYHPWKFVTVHPWGFFNMVHPWKWCSDPLSDPFLQLLLTASSPPHMLTLSRTSIVGARSQRPTVKKFQTLLFHCADLVMPWRRTPFQIWRSVGQWSENVTLTRPLSSQGSSKVLCTLAARGNANAL